MKVKNLVEKDEYKNTVCSLTNEECSFGDCSVCEESINKAYEDRMREQDYLIPMVPKKLGDIGFFSNKFNTVAMFKIKVPIDEIIKNLSFPDPNEIPVHYDMSRLLVRWPHFVKMKYILSLGIPLRLMEVSDYLFAFYEYTVFLTAPVLTDEEFNNVK